MSDVYISAIVNKSVSVINYYFFVEIFVCKRAGLAGKRPEFSVVFLQCSIVLTCY